MKTDVIKQIRDIGVIPVVRASTADEAMRAIDAIREGGISVLEITMTVPGAVKVEEVAKRYGKDAVVGRGLCSIPKQRRRVFRVGRSSL